HGLRRGTAAAQAGARSCVCPRRLAALRPAHRLAGGRGHFLARLGAPRLSRSTRDVGRAPPRAAVAAGTRPAGRPPMNIILRWRRLIVAALHFALIAASNYAAFWLRFDGHPPDEEVRHFLQALPALLIIR